MNIKTINIINKISNILFNNAICFNISIDTNTVLFHTDYFNVLINNHNANYLINDYKNEKQIEQITNLYRTETLYNFLNKLVLEVSKDV